MSAVDSPVAAAGTGTGTLSDLAALGMAAVGVLLVFVAKGWMSSGTRGRIKFNVSWHGSRTAYAVGAVVGGFAALLYFGPRLTSDVGSAGPAVIVAVVCIAGGAVALTWSAKGSTRRRIWGAAGALVALIIVASVAGPVFAAIGSVLGQAGETAGRAGSATARATPYVLGFLVLAAAAGLLCYWVVDRAASRDQMFKRAGVFLLGVAVLLVVLVLAGVVAPEELFAGNGGGQ